MYTFINGSPKVRDSNSLKFLNYIKCEIDNYNLFELRNCKYNDLINSINDSSVIVFAFPLYVDSPTSIMLDFLDYMVDKKISLENKLVYVITNCGFRECKHNITAINIIKRWCILVNAIYSGGILIGAGEVVGKDQYKFISHDFHKKIKFFSNVIKKKEKINDMYTTVDILNNNLYCFFANMSWSRSGKKNKLSCSDLKSL